MSVRGRSLTTIAFAVVICSLGLAGPPPAAAWEYWGCKFSIPTLKWKDATTREGYATPAQQAANAWTAVNTPVTLAKVTAGANIQVNDGNFGDPSFNGVTYWAGCDVNGHWTHTVQTWFNRAALDTKSTAARMNTMVHELGHALGLGHTFGTYSCSTIPIMFPTDETYTQCGLTSPQADDVAGVAWMYR